MTDKTSFGPAGQTSKFPVVEFSLVIQHNSVHEFAAAPCSGAEGGGSSGTGSRSCRRRMSAKAEKDEQLGAEASS